MTFLNLLKILEITLNDGVDPKTGIQLLPGRGDLRAFESFEDLYQAFYEQFIFYARTSFHLDAVADISLEEMVPDAFCSALVDDCLGRGLTIKEGGAVYDVVSGLQSGVSNVANALMAVNQLVYEEKKLTPVEVMAALAANFENEGGEMVRQRLLRAPKYGNDVDEVDQLAIRVMNDYQGEMVKYHNSRFGRVATPAPPATSRPTCPWDLRSERRRMGAGGGNRLPKACPPSTARIPKAPQPCCTLSAGCRPSRWWLSC
jgi:formate C-acetyltransferase